MTRQRRTFSTEFKHDAALLVLDQGYSVIEASKSLGIGETALRRWVDQLRIERDGGTPKGKALTPEQQKIQELEARINRLEREKAILKKHPGTGLPAVMPGWRQPGQVIAKQSRLDFAGSLPPGHSGVSEQRLKCIPAN